jgi:hypothetical protein
MNRPILERLFGSPEDLRGHGKHDTYLYRWTLLKTRFFKIYLHNFVGDDWCKDFHDHPKRFLTIGLKGSYIEETPNGRETFTAPWIRSFPANHIHRLLVPSKTCWTFVVVFKQTREWGFWRKGKFIPYLKYLFDENYRDIDHRQNNS